MGIVNFAFSMYQPLPRFPVPIKEGIYFIALERLLYLKADGNYCLAFLEGEKKPIQVLKSMKTLEGLLASPYFMRIHLEYLINTNHIIRYEKAEGGTLVMSGELRLPLARSRRKKFLESIAKW
jgi:two-component system, LytTR family, response regulator